MIFYISLPISGHDEAIQRLKAYNMELKLKDQGHEVINPFDIADRLRAAENREPTWQEFMDVDLFFLEKFSEGVVFMNGWPDSRGCMDEMDCAIRCGKLIFTEENIWQAG